MKKINNIIKNSGQIVEGIKNSIFKQEDVELIAGERKKICDGCDKLDLEGKHCIAPGTQPCCGECGCSLAFKLRALSAECPLKKWVSIDLENE